MSAKAYHQASAGETETKDFRKNYMSDKITACRKPRRS